MAGEKTCVLINGIHAKSGGGVTYLKNVLPYFAQRDDLDTHLLLHKDQLELFYPFPERVRPHIVNFNARFFHMLWWEQYAIPILARVMNADVTFSPANYGPLLAPTHIIMLRNSLSVVGRETRLRKRFYWLALAIMTGLSLLLAKRALAVSDYARRALSFRMDQLFVSKIKVIHHGVSGRFVTRKPLKTSGHKLLVVADLYVQKNLHTLLYCIDRLRSLYSDIHLDIAGRPVDQGYASELQDLVMQLNLDKHVNFLGGVSAENLVELYQSATVFIFPSTVETFGNPLVEAMACGCAIASSNTAAMPEIVGDAAIYFNPLSIEEMTDAIEKLFSDVELRQAMREKALKRAQNFSWERTADLTADLLIEVARKERV